MDCSASQIAAEIGFGFFPPATQVIGKVGLGLQPCPGRARKNKTAATGRGEQLAPEKQIKLPGLDAKRDRRIPVVYNNFKFKSTSFSFPKKRASKASSEAGEAIR